MTVDFTFNFIQGGSAYYENHAAYDNRNISLRRNHSSSRPLQIWYNDIEDSEWSKYVLNLWARKNISVDDSLRFYKNV